MPLPLHPAECTSAAPGISPGPVENEEIVLRELYSPQRIKNGKLIKRAIPIQELREMTRGLSVHRMKYTSADFLKDRIKKRLSIPREGEPWVEEGVAVLAPEDIRAIRCQDDGGDDEQAFIVKDTARPDHPGHASVHAADPEKRDEDLRELRSDLLKYFERGMSVDEAFRHYPPP